MGVSGRFPPFGSQNTRGPGWANRSSGMSQLQTKSEPTYFFRFSITSLT
jgi:hypothetical protein